MSTPTIKPKKKPYVPPTPPTPTVQPVTAPEETLVTEAPVEPVLTTIAPVAPKVAKEAPALVAKDKFLKQAQAKYGITRGVINWSESISKTYLLDGKLPAQTTRGNWVSDVTRVNRLDKLSDSEYLDFVEGFYDDELNELEVELCWKAVYERFKLPGNVSFEAAKDKLLHNKDYNLTVDGVLIDCSSRCTLPLSKWTYLEVRAALLNDISRGEHTEEQLLNRFKEILQLPKNANTELITRNLKEDVKSTMYDQLMEAKLEEYKSVRIGPNRKGPREVGTAHALFLRQVRQLITKEYPVFKEGWNILLGFVKREENTLFSDKVRYDHWDNVPLQGNDLEALESLLTLVKMSVENSNVGRTLAPSLVVDLTRYLGPQEDVEKIVAYYSR